MKIKKILIKALTKEIKRLKSELKDVRTSLDIEDDYEDIVARNHYLEKSNLTLKNTNDKLNNENITLTKKLNAEINNAKAWQAEATRLKNAVICGSN